MSSVRDTPGSRLRGLQGRPWAVLAVASAAFFLAQLDALVVTVAVPQIQDGLGATLGQAVWALTGYLLALAVALITGGRLGDLFGHRRVFLAGLAVFTLASAACGAAQTPGQLIAARVLQGLGAALFTPQTMAMLVAHFPAERRGTAFGVRGAAGGIAAVTAPVLGGLLVGALDWRWVFLVNVPVGAATLLLARLALPAAPPAPAGREGGPRPGRLDLPGVVLAAAALLCLSFAAGQGGTYGWNGRLWALLAAGGALSVGFLAQQRARQLRSPLVPFGLFADRGFSRMTACAVVVAATVTGLVLLLSVYFQSVAGYGALLAGLVLVPASACSAVLNPLAGRLSGRVEGRLLVLGGIGATAAGMLWAAALMRPGAAWPEFLLPLCLIGAGNAFLLTPLVTTALREVPARLSGAASGVLGTALQVGAMAGAATVGPLVQAAQTAQSAPSAGALRPAMVLLASVASVGGLALLASRTTPRVPIRTGHLERG
ncbi:DHA2 family efflux MFS transporter permease subunit [Streptomyces sp. NPDC051211]|uniref:DHA2 family efflux MFS transporter permease subunit n=1 Tax=Streptomyces sp. NPDC051211 TaxID=3154643 RepID=UPI00344B7F91